MNLLPRKFEAAFVLMLIIIPPSLWAQGAGKSYIASYGGKALEAEQKILAAGGKISARYPQIGLVVARSANPDFAAAIEANPQFEYVVEDQKVQWLPGAAALVDTTRRETLAAPSMIAQGSPFDAAFLSLQWNLFRTQTDRAWGITQGSPAVKVAVVDSGICTHHPEMEGKVDEALSTSFVPPEDDPCTNDTPPACPGCPVWEDRFFHGTFVAATISSNNLGTAGVAPNVKLIAVRVMNCDDEGAPSWIIAGIMYAANLGVDVINISIVGYAPTNERFFGNTTFGRINAAFSKAINYARSRGALVVAAAGNDGVDLTHDCPWKAQICDSGSALCVGGTTISDQLSIFLPPKPDSVIGSNYGISGPQIMAPAGGGPFDPYPDTPFNKRILGPCSMHSTFFTFCADVPTYILVQGTSVATPQVAGAAALVDSIAPKGPGSANAAKLEKALIQGADDLGKPGADNIYSHGRLNVYNALQK